MEAKATLKYYRMAPRKVRVVLDAIRDQQVDEALASLRFGERRAAAVVYKLLASAVANVKNELGAVETADLYVKEAYADEGPTLRRFRPRAMGRATRINKRTSHVTIVVAEND